MFVYRWAGWPLHGRRRLVHRQAKADAAGVLRRSRFPQRHGDGTRENCTRRKRKTQLVPRAKYRKRLRYALQVPRAPAQRRAEAAQPLVAEQRECPHLAPQSAAQNARDAPCVDDAWPAAHTRTARGRRLALPRCWQWRTGGLESAATTLTQLAPVGNPSTFSLLPRNNF